MKYKGKTVKFSTRDAKKVAKIAGVAAAGAAIHQGAKHDTGSSGAKKVGKAVLLGGGYGGYQRARNEGQSRLRAGTKAVLGGAAYSAYKGAHKVSATEKINKVKNKTKKEIRNAKDTVGRTKAKLGGAAGYAKVRAGL